MFFPRAVSEHPLAWPATSSRRLCAGRSKEAMEESVTTLQGTEATNLGKIGDHNDVPARRAFRRGEWRL